MLFINPYPHYARAFRSVLQKPPGGGMFILPP